MDAIPELLICNQSLLSERMFERIHPRYTTCLPTVGQVPYALLIKCFTKAGEFGTKVQPMAVFVWCSELDVFKIIEDGSRNRMAGYFTFSVSLASMQINSDKAFIRNICQTVTNKDLDIITFNSQ